MSISNHVILIEHIVSLKNIRQKGRVITVKFSAHKFRKFFFMNKRKFKGTNISITKILISLNMENLQDSKDKCGFNKVWNLLHIALWKRT